jgi:hypothetical protein
MRRKKDTRYSTYLLLVIFLFPLSLGAYVYLATDFSKEAPAIEQITNASSVTPPVHIAAAELAKKETFSSTTPWQEIYPNTLPITIGTVSVEASVARTWPERIRGLSDTPYLPEQVVKVFVFDTDGYHSIWMKDMNYDLDIIWVDADYTIVDFVAGVTPKHGM